ncbi:hypothetical protein L345_14430, partial [Ophiophagus hannah]
MWAGRCPDFLKRSEGRGPGYRLRMCGEKCPEFLTEPPFALVRMCGRRCPEFLKPSGGPSRVRGFVRPAANVRMKLPGENCGPIPAETKRSRKAGRNS